MARRQRRDLSVFESSCHLPICLLHTMEASHCPFTCWTSSRKAVNTNFYSLWFDPTGNRTRVYRISSRRSIHSTTDRIRGWRPKKRSSSRNLCEIPRNLEWRPKKRVFIAKSAKNGSCRQILGWWPVFWGGSHAPNCTPLAPSLLLSLWHNLRLGRHISRLGGTSSDLGGHGPEMPPVATGLCSILYLPSVSLNWRN